MSLLTALRKMLLGETWILPLGIGAAMGSVAFLRLLSRDAAWWPLGGGAILLSLLLVDLGVSVWWSARRGRR